MVEVHHETVLDSNQQHAGNVYAEALLGASEKAGVSDAVVAELESVVRDVFDALPRLEQALVSPRIPYVRKEAMLEQAFRGKMTPLLLNFLKLVTRRGRVDSLRAIARAARRRHNQLRGRIEVQVRSAEPLDAETQALVAQRLTAVLGRQVDLQLETDPEVVAGLVMRVGDTVYDGSVANRLARLRDEVVARASRRIRQDLGRFAASS